MFKAVAKVAQTKDLSKQLKQSLQSLQEQDVYIGIPEGQQGSHEDISDAELMYILTHGVREKAMREEMNDYMGITAGGMPIDRGFNDFLDNSAKMPYSAAYDLFIHEHGSPIWQIPPRPILEPAIRNSKDIIAQQLKRAVLVALEGRDASSELQKAGQMGVNAAQEWFTNPLNMWPANSPSTVQAKGSDRPNVDTGSLRNYITYVVAKKS